MFEWKLEPGNSEVVQLFAVVLEAHGLLVRINYVDMDNY